MLGEKEVVSFDAWVGARAIMNLFVRRPTTYKQPHRLGMADGRTRGWEGSGVSLWIPPSSAPFSSAVDQK